MDNIFNLKKYTLDELKVLSPQTLAFVGDSVYSLYIRHKIVSENNVKIKDLHSNTTSFVKAKAQSVFIDKIYPNLTANELSVYKRGRNYKTTNVAKSSSVLDYKKATGLECLLGYLYLAGEFNRLNEILSASVSA